MNAGPAPERTPQPPHPSTPAGQDEHSAACSCTSETLPTPTGEILVLRVAGEVDLLTLPTLESALESHLQQRPRHLIVDLTRLTFCSVRGMAMLVDAAGAARDGAISYAVSGPPPWFERVGATLWEPNELPTRYRDLPTAVTALAA